MPIKSRAGKQFSSASCNFNCELCVNEPAKFRRRFIAKRELWSGTMRQRLRVSFQPKNLFLFNQVDKFSSIGFRCKTLQNSITFSSRRRLQTWVEVIGRRDKQSMMFSWLGNFPQLFLLTAVLELISRTSISQRNQRKLALDMRINSSGSECVLRNHVKRFLIR